MYKRWREGARERNGRGSKARRETLELVCREKW